MGQAAPFENLSKNVDISLLWAHPPLQWWSQQTKWTCVTTPSKGLVQRFSFWWLCIPRELNLLKSTIEIVGSFYFVEIVMAMRGVQQTNCNFLFYFRALWTGKSPLTREVGQSFWSNDVSLAQVGRFYVNIPILVCTMYILSVRLEKLALHSESKWEIWSWILWLTERLDLLALLKV